MNNSDDPSSICSQHTERLTIAGLPVDVVRKGVAALDVGVYPPHGQVKVSAPLHVSNEAVQQAVVERLGWIREQQALYAAPPAETEPKIVTGESVWYLGQSYRLKLVEQTNPAGSVKPFAIGIIDDTDLRLSVPKGADHAQCAAALDDWYRAELLHLLPPLLQRWQPIVGREASTCGVKRMATRWGSCNPGSRRIWLNLTLACKPPQCLEYILVHELAHLLERRHGQHFDALMEEFMPSWRTHRDTLNQAPQARPDWAY